MKNNMGMNTLFLGNGFSRSVFSDMPTWDDLLGGKERMISSVSNTLLYEINLMYKIRDGEQEEEIKQKIVEQLGNGFSIKKVKPSINELDKFGKYLAENNVNDIIATNYDKGIELILCEICGYQEVKNPRGLIKERTYSIRTYKEFRHRNGHMVKLWKIHGDVDRIVSITLGFDQYCGEVSKLSNYIKGKYISDQGKDAGECKHDIEEKCSTYGFDNLSWAELFFSTNVYIAGFGMDFSEIDIWWLLNKHARIKNKLPQQIKNNIYYLYNEKYDAENQRERFEAIYSALSAFQVECCAIESGDDYINNIFSVVAKNA